MPDPATSVLVPFTMPSLGADMDAGTVIEWLVAPGEMVKRGDILAVVETDKSDLDVESFVDGRIVEIVVPLGEKVPVGTVLATVDATGQPAPAPPVVSAPPVAAAPPVVPRPPAMAAPGTPTTAHVCSPVLRHLADDLHVDVAHVHASGPGGRVTRDDIEQAAHTPEQPQTPAPPEKAAPQVRAATAGRAAQARRVSPRARRLARERGIDIGTIAGAGVVTGDAVLGAAPAPAEPPAPEVRRQRRRRASGAASESMRSTIARLMAKSWKEIPHYHVGSRIDVSRCLRRIEALNEGRPAASRLLPAAAIAHAAARAAAAVPEVNGFWIDDAHVGSDAVHLGVVVALRGGGLLAPVIHDAATKDLDTVMSELRDLVTRARSGRLRASDVSGATFTMTALGEGEVEWVTPIIHPPQVAILGLGAVHDEPWAEGGMVGVRPVLRADLAGDHRAIDGRIGSLYIATFNRILQELDQP